MEKYLTKTVKKQIRIHAESFPEEEVCGLIVENTDDFCVVKTENIARNKKHSFEISPMIFTSLDYRGLIPHAVYHSHPNDKDTFSVLDKINADALKYELVMYHNKSQSFKVYHPKNEDEAYVGRPFKLGESDCVSLVRDFYKEELNININKYDVNKYWIKKGNLILDNYKKEGFERVFNEEFELKDLNLYDLIICKNEKFDFPCHVMIYLGGGMVLQHIRDYYSTVSSYQDHMRKNTMFVLRHKELNG